MKFLLVIIFGSLCIDEVFENEIPEFGTSPEATGLRALRTIKSLVKLNNYPETSLGRRAEKSKEESPSLKSDFMGKVEEAVHRLLVEAGDVKWFWLGTRDLPELRAAVLGVQLRATGGYFYTKFEMDKGLSATIHARSVSVRVPLSLRAFQAGYNDVTVQVGGVHGTGKVTWTNPNRNSIHLELEYARTQGSCGLKVRSLEVKELGGLVTAVKNLSPFQSAAKVLGEWLVTSLEEDFRRVVGQMTQETMSQVVASKEENLCEILPM